MLQNIVSAVTTNPVETAGLISSWVALASIGIVLGRLLGKWPLVRWFAWTYLGTGMGLSIWLPGSMILNRGDLAEQMQSPVRFFVLSFASAGICELIWPLTWSFLLLWFSNVDDTFASIARQLAISATLAAVFGFVVAFRVPVRLRAWVRARGAAGPRD